MPAVEDHRTLVEIPLFAGLSDDELATLNQQLHRKTFAAGSGIVSQAQPGELVFILIDGSVKIGVDQIDGSEVILAFLGPGDTFGEMGLIDSAGRSANVVALETCRCLVMDREAFRRSVKASPRMSYNLVRLLTGRLRLANEQIQALSSLDVRGRVARQLLAFAHQYGRPATAPSVRIPLRLTQSDVAALVGASRERVNQVIVDFKDSGFISVDPSHHITVHDREALVVSCR